MSRTRVLITLATSTALLLAACGADGGEVVDDGEGIEGRRVAAVFSGPTTDADYNALGLMALEDAEAAGAEIGFSESVPVPDVERVIREYVADGFDVIWTHGSQFYDATAAVAEENPDVDFIAEFDGEPENQLANLWVLDRNFHTSFYPIGVLASELSQTGVVGYVGGLSLPFSYSEVNAMQQAIDDRGAQTTINAVWTGDFNDPARAQQITEQLLSQGADVIIGSLNLGAVGTFQAVEDRPAGEVWVTAKYTDKSQFSEDHYAGSVVYDFIQPLTEVLERIAEGERTGYYPMGFDTGVQIQLGDSVPEEVRAEVEQVVSEVVDGTITVERNTDPVE